MPFFGKKKVDKSGTKEKTSRLRSQFFDDNDNHQIIDHRSNSQKERKVKRHSKSTFYDVTDGHQADSDTASIHSNSSSVSNHLASQAAKFPIFDLQEDLGQPKKDKDIWNRRESVLSRSFHDCLHDKELIAYFIQYMSSKNLGSLVRFWLDAENFTVAYLSRMRIHSLREGLPAHSGDELSVSELDTMHSSERLSLPHDNLSGKNSLEDLQERIKEDAVSIYSRYIALDCVLPIGITDDIRDNTISKICSEDGKVDPMCFKACQKYAETMLNNEHFLGFLESSFYRKYQIDVLTSGNIHLTDILYNDNAMFYFMEYMEQEGASKLIQFWMAADNFQSQLEATTAAYLAQDAQADAMILYDKYFSLQAAEPLGFSDKVRMHVEMNICREEGPLPDCFLIPKSIILQTIDKTLFSSFLQSQMYYRFLTELINSVQPTAQTSYHGTPNLAHRRSVSTSNFDSRSIDSHGHADGQVSAGSSQTDLRKAGSSNRLAGTDDDVPLWRRVNHKKSMSLGLLNELGQFTSELELEPIPDIDKKKGNRFSRKKKEKEKAQEDMAWQIARMIISDVNKEVSGNEPTPVLLASRDKTKHEHR